MVAFVPNVTASISVPGQTVTVREERSFSTTVGLTVMVKVCVVFVQLILLYV